MFPRVDNLIERWASIYKPIQHDPTKGSKARRFFRFDSLEKALGVTSQFTTFKTPVVGVVTQFDGVSHGKLMELEVIVFVFTKQLVPRSDAAVAELAASDAKYFGADICNDLWVWLCEQKKQSDSGRSSEDRWLTGLDTDNVAIMSYPVMLNDWWATSLELKVQVPRQKCVDKGKYIEQ